MRFLLIMPTFYNYYSLVCKEIENMGHSVIFFPDELPINTKDRIYKRINSHFLDEKFNTYISSIVSQTRDVRFDRVIIIFAGRYFQKNHIEMLRRAHPESEFIYYTWDSIKNFQGIKDFYKCFDKRYSFDKNDCYEYDFSFLPLFYSNEYIENDAVYDFSSVMTYGKEKALNYQRIINALPASAANYQYLVMKHKSTYLYNKLRYPSCFDGMSADLFKFSPMSQKDTNILFSKSKAVIDCPLEGQNGLTMRTFEVLHLNRKLITTNSNIKNYDFYSPDNICVINNEETILPEDFFDKPFNKMFSLGEKYSLSSFVKSLCVE